MLGAIVGDIVGSRFEWHNIKTKDFELFAPGCRVTDDSIMSLAVAKAILDCKENYEVLSDMAVECMQDIGGVYPYCGYGGKFKRWIYSFNPRPYYSYGNGAAMRVSSCGLVAKSLSEAKELSYKVTCVSHDHPEGIKGAEATAVAVYLARNGYDISDIDSYISKNYYDMNFTLDGIRTGYKFDSSCQGTVPQAIKAFLESDSFEDAIRNAISIGGDSDTLAAISGGIAGAYYGVPEGIREKSLTYLDGMLLGILKDFELKYGKM